MNWSTASRTSPKKRLPQHFPANKHHLQPLLSPDCQQKSGHQQRIEIMVIVRSSAHLTISSPSCCSDDADTWIKGTPAVCSGLTPWRTGENLISFPPSFLPYPQNVLKELQSCERANLYSITALLWLFVRWSKMGAFCYKLNLSPDRKTFFIL